VLVWDLNQGMHGQLDDLISRLAFQSSKNFKKISDINDEAICLKFTQKVMNFLFDIMLRIG